MLISVHRIWSLELVVELDLVRQQAYNRLSKGTADADLHTDAVYRSTRQSQGQVVESYDVLPNHPLVTAQLQVGSTC